MLCIYVHYVSLFPCLPHFVSRDENMLFCHVLKLKTRYMHSNNCKSTAFGYPFFKLHKISPAPGLNYWLRSHVLFYISYQRCEMEENPIVKFHRYYNAWLLCMLLNVSKCETHLRLAKVEIPTSFCSFVLRNRSIVSKWLFLRSLSKIYSLIK